MSKLTIDQHVALASAAAAVFQGCGQGMLGGGYEQPTTQLSEAIVGVYRELVSAVETATSAGQDYADRERT
jgi:hypothetical protein